MESLNRPAFDREAKLGDFYNARTDQFLNKSCLKLGQTFPKKKEKTPDTYTKVISSSNLDEKFSSLNLSGDILLSICSGLVKPIGASSFIFQPKTNQDNVWAGLANTITTEKDEIDLETNESLDAVDIDSFVSDATHILVGITLGGSAVFTAECTPPDHERRNEDEATLVDIMKNLEITLNGGYTQPLNFRGLNITSTVYSDLNGGTKELYPELNAAITAMKQLPMMIQGNRDNSSVPLMYHFLELSVITDNYGLNEIADRTVRFVDEGLIRRSVLFFDQLSSTKDQVKALIASASDQGRYLPILEADSRKLFKTSADLDMKESNFKESFRTFLIRYRSGKDDNSFSDQIEEGFLYINNLKKELLDRIECIADDEFVVFVNAMMAKNVRISRSYQQLRSMLQNSEETYVLFASKQLMNQEEWENKKRLFSRLVNDHSEPATGIRDKKDKLKPNFFLVDCESYTDAIKKYDVQKCAIKKFCKFKEVEMEKPSEQSDDDKNESESNIALEDDKQEEEVDRYSDEDLKAVSRNFPTAVVNDVCLALSQSVKKETINVSGLVQLRLPCPRHRKNCGQEIHTWTCATCKGNIMYDFKDNFYCKCGLAPIQTYKFKCTHKNHGDDFATFPLRNLCESLAKIPPPRLPKPLKPPKPQKPSNELNILVLGETGVGKSTWINAFKNYMQYDNFQQALRAKNVNVLIPTKFTIVDSDFIENDVTIGVDENKARGVGDSATKDPRSYLFKRKDFTIRLIDTPGIGDTAGFDQDKKNFEKILSYLSQYDKIHGICILLQPNNARLTVMFRFCVKELLTHLHKDTVRNIVFCFTNTRGSDYRPGDTFPALKKLLEENNENVRFKLWRETVFCVDSESFRFLLAQQQGVNFSEKDEANAEASWKHSAGEIERMIGVISGIEPHLTKNTLSLNSARTAIVKMTRPLAEITKNLHNNVAAIEAYKLELQDKNQNMMLLAEKIHTPQVDIICKPLPYPCTVCTASGCTTIVICGGHQKIDCTTHCHDPCYLNFLQTEKVGTEGLRDREAINPVTEECKICKCKWNLHMHIAYDTEEVRVNVEDREVAKKIKTEKDAENAIRKKLTELNELKNQLDHEHEKIANICAQFGAFLKENAITPYNDALGEYLEHLIRQEQEKAAITNDYKTVKGLTDTLNSYKQEVDILKMATSQGILYHLEPEDIHDLIEQLYQLPLMGKKLQGIVGVVNEAHDKFARDVDAMIQNPVFNSQHAAQKRNQTSAKPTKMNQMGRNKKKI